MSNARQLASLPTSKGILPDKPFTSWAEVNASNAVPAEGFYWVQFSGMSDARQVLISPAISGDGDKNVMLVFQSNYASIATVNTWGHLPITFRRMIVRNVYGSGVSGWAVASSDITWGTPTVNYGVNVSSSYHAGAYKIISRPAGGGLGIYTSSQAECNWGATNEGAIGAGFDGTSCGSFPNNVLWGTGDLNAANTPTYSNRGGEWQIWIGEN